MMPDINKYYIRRTRLHKHLYNIHIMAEGMDEANFADKIIARDLPLESAQKLCAAKNKSFNKAHQEALKMREKLVATTTL
jgi:hypothetical protein